MGKTKKQSEAEYKIEYPFFTKNLEEYKKFLDNYRPISQHTKIIVFPEEDPFSFH